MQILYTNVYFSYIVVNVLYLIEGGEPSMKKQHFMTFLTTILLISQLFITNTYTAEAKSIDDVEKEIKKLEQEQKKLNEDEKSVKEKKSETNKKKKKRSNPPFNQNWTS